MVTLLSSGLTAVFDPLSKANNSTAVEFLEANVYKINEAFGTDFTEADQLFLDQIKEDALERDQLKRIAKVNSKENFALEFDDTLTELFIDRMDQNKELFQMYMDNEEFQNLVTELLRQEVYDAAQKSGA